MTGVRYIVVADPGSKRWIAYHRELQNHWTGKLSDILLVDWRDVIAARGNLDGLPAFSSPGILRIESPGRDFAITRRLIQIGAAAESISDDQLPELTERTGWLAQPRLAHIGIRQVLQNMSSSLQRLPNVRPLQNPSDVASMFDKTETCHRLRRHSLGTPPLLEHFAGESEATAVEADELIQVASACSWQTTYVKLNFGSSGSGIVVLTPELPRPYGISTMTAIDGRFYNTRRPRRLSGKPLRDALNFLLRQGTCIQQGIRKAKIQGRNFDVRVIVIDGKVEFTIFRLSHGPVTNLHLGGSRGDWKSCRQAIPTRSWLDAMDGCIEAAGLYETSVVGIDLVFDQNFLNHFILEVNAFGDFVPGWTDARGKTIHQREIELLQQRLVSGD